ncbi:hypothetical protein Tco_1107691 [Tanacetum coccineum]
MNTTNPSVVVTDSSASEYDLADESSVCSIPLPPLEKLGGAKPVSRPNTIKLILKSNSTFKPEALKGIICEPSSAFAKVNRKASALNTNLAPAVKLKNVKIEDDLPFATIIKEINDLKLQVSKSQSFGSNNNKNQQCKRTDHKTCDHVKYISIMNMSQQLKSLGRSSSRSKIPRPSKRFFPPCTHHRSVDHLSDDYLYYPICGICGSYDHKTNGHNKIISLEREINPRNPQHPFKRCEPVSVPSKRAEDKKGLCYQMLTNQRLPLNVLSDQYGQNDQTDHNDQNDHPAQLNEILNDDLLGHSNHNNENPIIEKLTNTKDIQNPKLSSPAKNNLVLISV